DSGNMTARPGIPQVEDWQALVDRHTPGLLELLRAEVLQRLASRYAGAARDAADRVSTVTRLKSALDPAGLAVPEGLSDAGLKDTVDSYQKQADDSYVAADQLLETAAGSGGSGDLAKNVSQAAKIARVLE